MKIEWIVKENEQGRRLQSILEKSLGVSHRLMRTLRDENRVCVNGRFMKFYEQVYQEDHIEVILPEESASVQPEALPIDVCYEDPYILVINKPAGQLSHPSARERNKSTLAAAGHYLLSEHLVPHCVHRLDRDTSGLLLLAKHAHIHHLFDLLVRNHQLKRSYMAICYFPSHLSLHQWYTIQSRIAQNPERPSKRIVQEEMGQEAITHFFILAKTQQAALVQLELETGRTHQIRLHMASVRMPLIGDRDYGQLSLNDDESSFYTKMASRQMLHAYQLAFFHPVLEKSVCVTAEPRSEMIELWEWLGGSSKEIETKNCVQFDTNDKVNLLTGEE